MECRAESPAGCKAGCAANSPRPMTTETFRSERTTEGFMRTLAGFTLTLAALALVQQPSFGQYPFYRPDGFAVPQAPQFVVRQNYGSYAPNGYYTNNGYVWPMPQQQMMPQGMYPPQMYQPYNWQNQSNQHPVHPPHTLPGTRGF